MSYDVRVAHSCSFGMKIGSIRSSKGTAFPNTLAENLTDTRNDWKIFVLMLVQIAASFSFFLLLVPSRESLCEEYDSTSGFSFSTRVPDDELIPLKDSKF